MKCFIFSSVVLLSLSAMASSSGGSSKVCFGSSKSPGTAKVVLKIDLTKLSVHIKTVTRGGSESGFGDNGMYEDESYPSEKSTIKGRDGKTYLTFAGESGDEYSDTILVDSELLKPNTTGLLQFRGRGEGFFNSVFVCRDDKR